MKKKHAVNLVREIPAIKAEIVGQWDCEFGRYLEVTLAISAP